MLYDLGQGQNAYLPQRQLHHLQHGNDNTTSHGVTQRANENVSGSFFVISEVLYILFFMTEQYTVFNNYESIFVPRIDSKTDFI